MSNETENDIIIKHVHPLSERVAVMESEIVNQEKMMNQKFTVMDDRVGRIEQILTDMTVAISQNHDLVKKIWNSMWGGGIVLVGGGGAIWAVTKFVLPLVAG